MNPETFKANVVRLPTREEMTPDVNEQLIVEFYSRF
jgi:small subunit ribosomal protein S4